MASSRHLGRVITLQVLYEYHFQKQLKEADSLPDIINRHMEYRKKQFDNMSFVTDFTQGVLSKKDELDALIQPLATQRPLGDIPLLDHYILLMGVYELCYSKEIPPKGAINESVELAKSFGGLNTSKFINGVLGAVYRQLVAAGKIVDENLAAGQTVSNLVFYGNFNKGGKDGF